MFLAPTVSSAQQFHPDSLRRGRVSLLVKTISRHNFNLLQSVQQTLKHLSSFGVIFEPCEDSVFPVLFDQTLVCRQRTLKAHCRAANALVPQHRV